MSDAPDFTRVPDGMFSEPVDLIEYRLQLGLLHPPSADGIRVAIWNGEHLRHLTPDAARAYADWIDAGPGMESMAPVGAALRTLADRVVARESELIASASGVSGGRRAPINYEAMSKRAVAKMLRDAGINA